RLGAGARSVAPGAPSAVLPTAIFTLLALLAFASNSLLTRLALGAHAIDAASFTAIRLLAGAVVLVTLVRARDGRWRALRGGGIAGPAILFAYAAPFSLAYVRIGAAVGALVLFGAVQLAMLGFGLSRGERPAPRTWAGLALATGGLLWLTIPAASRPDPIGVALMIVAGAAWAAYTIAGRTTREPVAENARNFLWSGPLALLMMLASTTTVSISGRGALLAGISGGLTSGLGYVVWYRALPRLSVTQAAVAQVAVPVVAAAGAVVLLGEPLTLRLVLAGACVLAGIGLVVSRRLTASSS
ncbi:MAG: DMT family transporter, partial [Vicinamibacteraceae bacterium]